MKSLCCLLFAVGLLSGCQNSGLNTGDRLGVHASASLSNLGVKPFSVSGFEVEPLGSEKKTRYSAETIRLLDKPVSLKTKGITLEALITFVRTETEANIVPNWATPELAGIDADSLVTIHATEIPAWKFLEMALAWASADCFDDDRASFQAHDGVVSISTLREIKLHTVTRTYDVSWYINLDMSTMYQLYDKPEPKKEPTKKSGQDQGDQSEAKNPTTKKDVKKPVVPFCATCISSQQREDVDAFEVEYVLSRAELIDQVIEIIHTTVGDPDEWLDEESTLTEINNVLIIKTTPKNHEDIAVLLKSLHQARVHSFERRARLREVVKLLKEAEAYRMQQSYNKALKLMDQALKVAPDHAETHVLRKIVVGAISD